MAGSLLEAVARARDKRAAAYARYQTADELFLNTLVQAQKAHSWQQIADVAGVTRARVRQRVYEARKNGATNG